VLWEYVLFELSAEETTQAHKLLQGLLQGFFASLVKGAGGDRSALNTNLCRYIQLLLEVDMAWLERQGIEMLFSETQIKQLLYYAGREGAVRLLRWLISHPAIEISSEDSAGRTAYQGVIEADNADLLEKLLSDPGLGMGIDFRDTHGQTLLHIAAQYSFPCLEKLLAKGLEVNAEDNEKRTPLWMAAAGGQLDCLRRLVELGTDVNRPNKNE